MSSIQNPPERADIPFEEQNRIQMEKMFNTSERVVKLWVSKFVDKPADVMFDDVPELVEPVIFYPSNKTGNKFLEFKLGIVSPDRKLKFPDELFAEEMISNTIQFFVYSTRVVYGMIMKTTDHSQAHDIHLEWDAENFTFCPVFFPDLKKKSDYLSYVFNHMMQVKSQIPEEKKEEWESDFEKLSDDIEETNQKMTDDKITEQIEEKQEGLNKYDRIGLCVRYLTQEELPDGAQIDKSLPVSDKRYEDAPDAFEPSENSNLSEEPSGEHSGDDVVDKVDQLVQSISKIMVDKK
jgi:hypothetical protein